ncbi:MAG: hypothetical protein ACLQVD_08045 [Capsulimonadaceae bacterium]
MMESVDAAKRAKHVLQSSTLLTMMSPLALSGLVLTLLLGAGGILMRLDVPHQPFKFLEYGVVCLGLPAGLLALAAAGKTRFAPPERVIVAVGTAAAVAISTCYALVTCQVLCLMLALLQVFLMTRAGALDGVDVQEKSGLLPVEEAGSTGEHSPHVDPAVRQSGQPLLLALLVCVTWAVWTTSYAMPWWHKTATVGLYRAALLAGTVLVVFVLRPAMEIVRDAARPGRDFGRIALGVLDALIVLLLLLASFRTYWLFSGDSNVPYHHWGVYIGPAQMVRQGGWLLWDVPSQYGFLSTLSIAFLPTTSVWTSFYYLIGVFQGATALFLYWIGRSTARSFAGRILSALLVLSAVFWIGTRSYGVVPGPQTFPSTGAFRFFWVYAVLAVLIYCSRLTRRGTVPVWPLAVGCVCWAIGVCWSVESAFYTSAAWLPAFYFIIWQVTTGRSDQNSPTLPRHMAWILAVLPPALVSGAVIGIDLFYRHGLQRLPDWSMYFEYARSFQSGFGELPLDFNGSIWVAFICALVPATLALTLFRKSQSDPDIGVLVAGASTVVAVSSYCMGRSHPNNLLNIMPACLAAALLSLRQLDRSFSGRSPAALLARACLIPILVTCMAATANTPTHALLWIRTTLTVPPATVDYLLPRYTGEAASLLLGARVGPTDPLFYYDVNLPMADPLEAEPRVRAYATPFSPLAAMDPLGPSRAGVYLERFTDRVHSGTWVLIPKHPELSGYDDSWCLAELRRYFVPVPASMHSSTNCTLMYFAYRGKH